MRQSITQNENVEDENAKNDTSATSKDSNGASRLPALRMVSNSSLVP
jgi:hypothetical protein